MAPWRDPTGLSLCRRPGCRRQIRWIMTKNNKPMPVDPHPTDAGNVAAYVDDHGTWRGRVLGHDQPHPWETVYMPHAATCPARQTTRPPVLPPNVPSLAEYRKRRRP